MAKSNKKYGVFALELIASLLFLAVSFAWLSLSSATFSGIWQPLLYGAAVVASISLFLASIGTLMSSKHDTFLHAIDKAVVVAGFSLAILTYGTSLAFMASVLGLVLGLIGYEVATVK